MRVVVVTPPEPLVAWEAAAQHLKLDDDAADQAYVEGLIAAVAAHLDGPDAWLGRAIGVQTLEARFDLFTCASRVKLPFPPVIELVSIQYLDGQDVLQTADLGDFEVLGRELVSAGSSFAWEGGSLRREAVRVRYQAGYETLPAPIKAAILLMVGDLYANRETTIAGGSVTPVPMSLTVESLLAPYRVFA
jgi:hypothetical protein